MRRMAMISQSVALERGETPAGVMLSRPEDWTEHVMVPTDIQALGDIWDHLAEKVPEQVCFTDDYHDGKVEMTYGEAFEVMNNIGSGFQKLGLEKGDKVSLFSDNSYRWLLADNAILRCGAASAVRGSAAPVDELGYILEHSESRGLVVENPDVYEKLSSKFPNLFKNLKFCVFLFPSDDYIPGQEGPEGTPLISYEDLIELGKQKPFEKVDVSKEDLASLIYTSGTTGKPKGVILNHKQFVHQMLYQTIQAKATGFMGTIRRMLKNSNPKPGEIFLSILPSWHIFERVAEYWILSRGGHMVYTNIKQFRNDIQKWKPHYLVAVPRLYETIYQGAEKKFNAKPTTAKLVSFFKGIGNKYLNAKRNLQGFRGQVGPIGKVKSALTVAATSPIIYLSDKLVWSKIRKGLGGRLKVAISGGSALPMYVEDFFELSKVPVIVGYGLTETTAPIANRLVQLNQRGTTGTPTAEVRIVHPETGAVLATGEQGEIQVRGDQVMMGYFKDDLATQKVLNRDGWFSTGDLGVINKKGILKITGRQKDTIVLLNGENIEPQPIEEALVASSVIDQVMLVGQDSNYLSALIVPSLDGLHEAGVIDNSDVKEITELREMNDQEGLATLATEISSRPAMEALILSEINKLNRAREGFRPDDNVRKFQLILSPFSMDNGLLTQTLKVKRKDVAKKYQHLIDAIYQR
eukprot:CAMPEP_0167756596 /NCGR_PEP_ID=MMETSP0110_2-20121227/9473_1 /TAXON_ID=629695 /ORGANISM="Gymnochlora sp., Strain CCMP2014" /LENGTH=691 /DNA_ID=CAMNT_0007642723 /DNA_START=238 /DNA_END=2313 /DNA_ORIENTATION=-